MPVLDPPPPLQMELPAVSFFGRSLDEYARFFALQPATLKRRPVLDVAAGPSSFTAEAARLGIDAVAVDPRYADSAGELTRRITHDYERMAAQMRAKPQLFRLKSFPSLTAAVSDRRAAATRFLSDFENNHRHGRYVRGVLPQLPFLDGAFDLVLCAHLLFIYAAQFDFDWHVAACIELARVSNGEVRIHPVCGADGRPYPRLAALRRALEEQGIASDVITVNYEFFAGSHTTLILSPSSP